MQNTLHIQTIVKPGNTVEITAPELREGDVVDVFLVLPNPPTPPRRSMLDFVKSLPTGPRSASNWDEIEARVQEERNAWDR